MITIIGNLIDNAFEAVADKKMRQVSFFITDIGHDIVIEVSDTGDGVPLDKMDTVFQRGYSSKGMKRGYGLANVKESVNEVNGWVELTNQKRRGGIYCIYTEGEINKGGIHLIHIVIAEDDFRVAQIHERLIEQLDGFNIIGKAANAKETMSLLAAQKRTCCF